MTLDGRLEPLLEGYGYIPLWTGQRGSRLALGTLSLIVLDGPLVVSQRILSAMSPSVRWALTQGG